MRTPTLGTVSYSPGQVPKDAAEMQRFFSSELDRIAAAINALAAGHIEITHVAPAKPREGDIRYADGTDWNPGLGAGIYQYRAAVWTFIG